MIQTILRNESNIINFSRFLDIKRETDSLTAKDRRVGNHSQLRYLLITYINVLVKICACFYVSLKMTSMNGDRIHQFQFLKFK